MKTISLGIIGFGFMGKIYYHSAKILNDLYPDAPNVSTKKILIKESNFGKKIISRYGTNLFTTSLEKFLSDKDLNAVYIALPNNLHREYVQKLIERNINTLCEKPLTINLASASSLLKLQKANRELNLNVVFQYRVFPAILKIKELLDKGSIGVVHQFRFHYLHGSYINKNKPITWRLDGNNGGAMMDLGSHLIDLTAFLISPIEEIVHKKVTVIKERPQTGLIKPMRVNVDDTGWILCKTTSGVDGSIEVSRVSTGSVDDLRIEIVGSKGTLRWKLEEVDKLEVFFETDPRSLRGFRKVQINQSYGGISDFPSIKTSYGWIRPHTHYLYLFLKSIVDPNFQSNLLATFSDALRVHRVLDKYYD